MKKHMFAIVCAIMLVGQPLNLAAQTEKKEKAKQISTYRRHPGYWERYGWAHIKMA